MQIDKPIRPKPSAARWGSDYIAEVMRALGIEYIALTPGASFRGLHDSLVNHLGNSRPGMLLALHEESAVAIAHGYAKISGKPLGVLLHSNVGLMHASMAIFNAWCERVPMLIYGGNGPMDANTRRPWVDWTHTSADQAALVRHFIKWDNQPASLPAAAEAMLRAALIAQKPVADSTAPHASAMPSASSHCACGGLPSLPGPGPSGLWCSRDELAAAWPHGRTASRWRSCSAHAC